MNVETFGMIWSICNLILLFHQNFYLESSKYEKVTQEEANRGGGIQPLSETEFFFSS